MPANRKPIEERFWPRVRKTDKCWIWIGGKVNKNKRYGAIAKGGRNGGRYSTHQLSWILANGPIPNGLQVLHKCDNPPCVRPDHLFLGTNADNMKDRHSKGGYDDMLRGSEHPRSKLTEKDVLKIRKLHSQGWLHREIAKEIGVVKGTVGFVLRGETWGHVK